MPPLIQISGFASLDGFCYLYSLSLSLHDSDKTDNQKSQRGPISVFVIDFFEQQIFFLLIFENKLKRILSVFVIDDTFIW